MKQASGDGVVQQYAMAVDLAVGMGPTPGPKSSIRKSASELVTNEERNSFGSEFDSIKPL